MSKNLQYAVNTILLTFVFGSLAYALFRGESSDSVDAPAPRPLGATVPIVEGVEPDFAVYFFYNDVYCETCERLEGFALKSVKENFADELKSGEITWRSRDMTTPENEHYALDFGLYSKSVVLVELEDGAEVRWENLEEIWDWVDDETVYLDYIRDSLKAFMEAAE